MQQTLYLGPPGTGKTTKLLSLMDEHLNDGILPSRIAYVSFTKKAAQEAATRACLKFGFNIKELPYFRTLHSLAFQELQLNKSSVMSASHFSKIGQLLGVAFSVRNFSIEEGIPMGSLKGDKLQQIDNLARVKRISVEEQCRLSNYDNVTKQEARQFADTLKKFKQNAAIVDFTGMLEQCLKVAPLNLDVVIIDEAQDLSKLQWLFVNHIFQNVPIKYTAGDDDQCHPAGTFIETTKGKKRIEELEPKEDRLLAYAKCDSYVYGKRNGGYRFNVAKRSYNKKMFSLSVAGNNVQATNNHKWLVKWTHEAKDSKIRVVYIMRRENKYRVGHCQLFNAEGSLHAWARARLEKADALWLLKTFQTSQESYTYEQIMSVKYGILQTTFEPQHNATTMTAKTIARVFKNAPEPRIAECLNDHDKYIDYPFRSKQQVNKKGAVLMQLQSCNVIPAIMRLPVYTGTNKVSWKKVDSIKVRTECCFVYSLDVEKYHTYIANDVVTCNSIYNWSGADADTFLNLDGDKEVLNKSYRLPKKIFNLADSITKKIAKRYAKKWSPKDSEGSIEWINDIEQLKFTNNDETWLLLARNNYQLGGFETIVRVAGLAYALKGISSINKKHQQAIYAWEALRNGKEIDFLQLKNVYKYMMTGHIKRGFKNLKTANENIAYSLEHLKEQHGLAIDTPWFEALNGMPLLAREYYRQCLRNGAKLNEPPKIHINTIHGVKGGEADNVVLLTDMAYQTYKNYLNYPDDEHRVFYVGVTRAKERLILVTPQTNLFYNI